MSDGQKSFVKGAAILGAAGLIVKFIGAIFRIPLTNIIGADGMANYQVAYPIYAALLVISSAGLPTAISKLVSERVTLGDYNGAHKVFQTAFKLLLIIGVVSTAVMLALSGSLASAAQIPSAKLALNMIAPSLFFVSILSAYRGYFQGLQLMSPTAMTQIIEQVIKLGAGLYFAWLWFPKGEEYGAAGALLGVTISEIIALAVIVLIYNLRKKQFKQKRIQYSGIAYHTSRSVLKDLLYTAIPVTLGACLMPIVNFFDTLIVTNTMAGVDYSAFNPLTPKTSFGVLTGSVNPLINMPAVLSLALCMSLVPAISEARAKKSPLLVSSRSAMGFKLSILIGLPCAVGLFILAGPVISLLYSSGLKPTELAVGTQLLQTLSIGVLFLTFLQTMTGVLQGAGHPGIPLLSLAIGAIVKVLISILLIRVPSININGAAIGTAACYGIAALLNVIFVIKHTKPSIKPFSGLLMPLLSTAVMGGMVYYMFKTLSPALGSAKAAIICIAAAVIIYVVMLFVTKAIRKEDMDYIPGGAKITRFMNKLGFWED
jgi:stage V sporulation protein B